MASSTRGRRVALVLVLAAGAAVALAGCGGLFGSGSSSVSTTLPTLPPTTTTTIAVATTAPTAQEYTIQRGDTMRKIAGKFNVTVEAILAINPKVTDVNKIQAGQVILIPPAAPAGATTAPAAATTAPPG